MFVCLQWTGKLQSSVKKTILIVIKFLGNFVDQFVSFSGFVLLTMQRLHNLMADLGTATAQNGPFFDSRTTNDHSPDVGAMRSPVFQTSGREQLCGQKM